MRIAWTHEGKAYAEAGDPAEVVSRLEKWDPRLAEAFMNDLKDMYANAQDIIADPDRYPSEFARIKELRVDMHFQGSGPTR